jgi:hypothetical protein
MKMAILDDYQDVALEMADWSSIPGNPEIKVFHDHVADSNRLPVAVERPSVTGRPHRVNSGSPL